ncbi:alpha/beta fold hydrolase [Coraliomargarita sp. SDUM461004]|uniref:Alpha/beta fold hydrolase n=1 Tax=Thalassobacterium sedimentorum TaxID=3041258 RepID=A0ABU1AIN1_9BACT|nr:alpha/beta fold hydrolase [Coraliomargarita sp. SDUM461004]MDQ8194641.1 alpha/beta fold hydrolase [Coraliomargarita sp. SDUM461004]
MSVARATQLPADVRLEYPFASNELRLKNGATMHYLDEGTGPVVLMLHGNPTWSFYYRNLVQTMVAVGYRCIVPDHIGCGLSDKPATYTYTLEQRIEDVEALLDQLAIDRFSLVVHDWGGAIGCGVAGRRPDALDKLVLLNTGAFRSKRIPLRIAAIKVPVFGEFVIRALNGFAGPAAIMAAKVPLKPAVKRGLLWPYRSWADRVAVWNFVKDIPLHASHHSYQTLSEVEAGLSQLKDKPVQLVWGAKDFCFNMHFYRRFQQFFPQAESAVYSQHGHYILEDGGSEVWQQVCKFLTQ